jgi:hypothetical protein
MTDERRPFVVERRPIAGPARNHVQKPGRHLQEDPVVILRRVAFQLSRLSQHTDPELFAVTTSGLAGQLLAVADQLGGRQPP